MTESLLASRLGLSTLAIIADAPLARNSGRMVLDPKWWRDQGRMARCASLLGAIRGLRWACWLWRSNLGLGPGTVR
jgi:hypothetical protein